MSNPLEWQQCCKNVLHAQHTHEYRTNYKGFILHKWTYEQPPQSTSENYCIFRPEITEEGLQELHSVLSLEPWSFDQHLLDHNCHDTLTDIHTPFASRVGVREQCIFFPTSPLYQVVQAIDILEQYVIDKFRQALHSSN